MKVRALIGFASADGGHATGELFDAIPVDAVEWLRAGLVERVDLDEAAVRSAPESAVTRKRRR